VTSRQDEHEARFAERKRKAEAARALKHIAEGSKPLDTEEFVQAIGGELREGENTYESRNRIINRVNELKASLTEDSPEEDVKEFLHLHRFACQAGGCWSKARKRWRQERGEVIPSAEWGNEDDLNARRAAKRKKRQEARQAQEDRLAALERQLAAPSEPPAPEPTPEPIDAGILGPLEALKAKIDRVRQTGSVDPSGVDDLEPLTTADLVNMVADNPPGSAAELEEAVRAIKGEARRRFSEQLNVELAELKNSRGLAGEDLKREQQVEYLLGLFARVGEI